MSYDSNVLLNVKKMKMMFVLFYKTKVLSAFPPVVIFYRKAEVCLFVLSLKFLLFSG